MELIQRQLRQQRGENSIVYPFTTYSIIFNIDKITNPILEGVCRFLNSVFMYDLPEFKESVSEQKELIIPTICYDNHEVLDICKKCNYFGSGRKQHEIVEKHFLKFDPKTIAIECPVFDDQLIGHIDILRVLDDRVQILDFKPNAHKETKAASQVFRYRKMLHWFMPSMKIEAAYFDDKHIYFVT